MGECPPDSELTSRTQRGSSDEGDIESLWRGAHAVIISSVHDYRSKRRGSIQAIADAMARRGLNVSFVSIRFSPLSLLRRDSRCFLWRSANRREGQGDISCFLWATPFHPFATRTNAGDKLTAGMHNAYAQWPNAELDKLIGSADVILVESGLGVALVPRIRRLNREAKLIYRGSDSLDTIGAHPHLATLLATYADEFDKFCLLSPYMAAPFSAVRHRTFCVPQGIERSKYDQIGESPYGAGRHVVSVGSMLFDRSVFDVAAEAFPEWTFHVIGCGETWKCVKSIILYPEMRFLDTLPYLAHARVGVAAYREAEQCRYLADSSMKLTQYAYLRLPSVCPHFAVGRYPHRFGYTPGDSDEIAHAFQSAFDDTFADSMLAPMSWDELVLRMISPESFADTRIPDQMFETDANNVIRNGAGARSFAADRKVDVDARAQC